MSKLPVMEPLFQKKTAAKLSLQPNESRAAGPSLYAQNLLKKMGWSEGQGLGKDNQGRASHVSVTKKADNAGVGCEGASLENFGDKWWDNVYGDALKNIPSADVRTKKRKRGNSESSSGSGSSSNSDSDSSEEDELSRNKAMTKQQKEQAGMPKKAAENNTSANDCDSDSDSDSEDEATKVSLMRDMSSYSKEDIELFMACGGRRLGKRAGRPQPGKMRREQKADRAFLDKWKDASATASAAPASSGADGRDALRAAMLEAVIVEVDQVNKADGSKAIGNETGKQRKTKKKKEKKRMRKDSTDGEEIASKERATEMKMEEQDDKKDKKTKNKNKDKSLKKNKKEKKEMKKEKKKRMKIKA